VHEANSGVKQTWHYDFQEFLLLSSWRFIDAVMLDAESIEHLVQFFHQDLKTKLEAQDRRINQEQQKEKKRLVKLQHELEETAKECHDLTTRIKVWFKDRV